MQQHNRGGEREISTTARAILHATPGQFAASVEFAGFTYRGLAEEVSTILRKERRKTPMACSHTTVSNLANGNAKRVHPRRAAAIERALKLPPGHLFRVEVFDVAPKRTTHAA